MFDVFVSARQIVLIYTYFVSYYIVLVLFVNVLLLEQDWLCFNCCSFYFAIALQMIDYKCSSHETASSYPNYIKTFCGRKPNSVQRKRFNFLRQKCETNLWLTSRKRNF